VYVTAGAFDVNSVVTVNGQAEVTISSGSLTGVHTCTLPISGNLSLTGGTGVTHTAAGDLTTGGTGTIDVVASTGDVTMADGTIYTAGSGTVTVTAAGNVVLGEIKIGRASCRERGWSAGSARATTAEKEATHAT